MTRKMRLAVFDLDYTIWRPEMFQLYGPPKLTPISKLKGRLPSAALNEARTVQEGMVLTDKDGDIMRIFDGANHALCEIKRLNSDGHDIKVAVASKTDEPSWAQICMNHMVIDDGSILKDVFGDLVEISYGSKVGHIRRLHHKTGIPFEEMCFFDNEYWNIQDVSSALPVKCIYTPDGMTRQAWEQAKTEFDL